MTDRHPTAPPADDPARSGSPARPRRRSARLLVALAAVTLAWALGACGGGTGGSGGGGGGGSASTPAAAAGAGTPTLADGVQVFDVTGTADLTFAPGTLRARTGRITLRLSVQQGSPLHNLTLPGIPGARTGFAMPGETESVTFTVDKPGTYPFVCTVHPNMRGTLVVT